MTPLTTIKTLAALWALFIFFAAHAEPICLPADAGGPGTTAVQQLVLFGRVISDDPADAPANGGTLAAGGKAVWWWCPGKDFRGQPFWTLEWFGWEFDRDQWHGMQGFRPDDADAIRAAWQISRQIDMSRTYFPTNVLLAAEPTRPKSERKTP